MCQGISANPSYQIPPTGGVWQFNQTYVCTRMAIVINNVCTNVLISFTRYVSGCIDSIIVLITCTQISSIT